MYEAAFNWMFLSSILALVLAIVDIAVLYKKREIYKKWMLIHGVFLICCATVVLGGFGYTFERMEIFRKEQGMDVYPVFFGWLELLITNAHWVIPFSIAAVGSFLITRAIGEDLRIIR